MNLPDRGSRIAITQLTLSDFRNYAGLRLDTGGAPVVLTGPNGAGKTSILEAVSLLIPGRGLRGAALADLARRGGTGIWAVSALVHSLQGEIRLGTGRTADTPPERRVVSIDGKTGAQHARLTEYASILWLTPQMGQIFAEGASTRRKFLDRLVYSFDAFHAARVTAYEKAMRDRNRLLQEGRFDAHWLAALEQKMAEEAAGIAAARLEAESHLNAAAQQAETPFPKPIITVRGEVEQWLREMPAVEAEARYRKTLECGRRQDAGAGRTLCGTHRSDMRVVHAEKRMEAEYCSTGEQKALLLAIVLADARARAAWRGAAPILLLDEVAAHLDETRRAALFEEILALGAQAWLTGTDTALFTGLHGRAQMLRVENGQVRNEEFTVTEA